jgi:hypothetical protein
MMLYCTVCIIDFFKSLIEKSNQQKILVQLFPQESKKFVGKQKVFLHLLFSFMVKFIMQLLNLPLPYTFLIIMYTVYCLMEGQCS